MINLLLKAPLVGKAFTLLSWIILCVILEPSTVLRNVAWRLIVVLYLRIYFSKYLKFHQKGNSYLVNRLWSITCSSSVQFYFLMWCYIGRIFHIENLSCNACVTWLPSDIISPIIICSKSFLFNPIGLCVEVNFRNVFHWDRKSFICALIYPNYIFREIKVYF